jgi:hypothetical protein
MDGKRARSLMRGVAALALAMSLAVAGACEPREVGQVSKHDRLGS